jgi:Fe2+ transport system protein B
VKNEELIWEMNDLWNEVETEINESEIREDSAKLA